MTNQNVKKILIDSPLRDVLDAYCEDVETVPTDRAKAFFRDWDGKVPGKLLRQCIFAGVFWLHSHPETVTFEKTDDQD